LRVPEFHGGSDPLVADKWKEDTDSALSYMGVDSIQRQCLAAYSLKGDAGIWYRSHFSAAERLTTSWEDFLQSFDSQFISSASRAGKEAELLALEQGDMSVDDYESKFISLSHFTDNMFQSEERKARMFERGLRPQIRRLVVSQRLRTLGDVVDSARALEIDFFFFFVPEDQGHYHQDCDTGSREKAGQEAISRRGTPTAESSTSDSTVALWA